LTPRQLERVRDLIEQRAGIYLPPARNDVVRRALAERMAACGAAAFHNYARLLAERERGASELRRLLPYLTIGETGFFRVPSHFDALRALVPQIIANRPSGVLHIWSAGCATGEEPYSIAMTLADMGGAVRGWQARILATDIVADAIERARLGCFAERALRGMPREQIARHFRLRDRVYEVSPALRRQVTFEEFNLAQAPYPRAPGGWDVIFCRNVTMYFREATTRQVAARLARVLRGGAPPAGGGFLLLGPTEMIGCWSEHFRTIEAAGAFVLVKEPAGRRRHGMSTPAPGDSAGHAHARPTTRAPASAPHPPLNEDEICARALGAIADDRWDDAQAILDQSGPRGRFSAHDEPGSCRVATAPRSPRRWLLRAWLKAARGEREAAAELCGTLLASDPLLAGAHYVLGLIACRAGEIEESIVRFQRAIYSDHDLAPAHYHLGLACCKQGDAAAARRAFRAALRALERGSEAWRDFAEGLAPEQWRRACQERLAALEA
jgi:chemotaxis protein methyltransferase CheR